MTTSKLSSDNREAPFEITRRTWEQAAMIPNVAHFIWYGQTLPWLHEMSIVSAARAGGFARLVLHHGPELDPVVCDRLRAVIEVRLIDTGRIFAASECRAELQALYDRLGPPAARANLLRAALLYGEGGVYLDMDTVTLGSFAPLLSDAVFCGVEPVAFPASLFERPSVAGYARAYALSGLRDVLRRSRRGPHWFRHVAHLFTLAPNNAIVGAEPGHPFFAELLAGMVALPPKQQLQRYALGTHLLQRLVRTSDSQAIAIHPPAVFYPLGPELSEHWFRLQRSTQLQDVVATQTRAVHWYASVRTRQWVRRIDAQFVKEHRSEQLISGLLAPYVDA